MTVDNELPISQLQSGEVSEAQIAVHWREEEYFYPPASFIGQANASDPAILARFGEDRFPECFKEYADLLSWDHYWHTTLDTSHAPFWKWFVGGRLNACYNCVDRHLATRPNQAAFIWVPEPESEDTEVLTYRELYRRVNEFAALLQDFAGVQTGDRVTFHLPMVPELPVSMLACARMGAIHSQVFGGFSGAACGGRIADSQSRILVTMDGYYRNGQLIDHKVKADEAVERAREEGVEVEKVLVWRRHPGQYASESPMVDGRDFFVDELLPDYRGATCRAGLDARRGPPVHHVLERHDRPPEGVPALHGRLPVVRGRHLQVLPGHPPGRHLLVLRRHRLDHRPLLHRVRPVGARDDQRDVRGRADLPRRRDDPGGSPSASGSTSSTPPRPPSACCARPGRTSRPSTTTTSNT